MKRLHTLLLVAFFFVANAFAGNIDRKALVSRNSPMVHSMDTLSSLSVGNGEFAFTVDATGLQSFPEYYINGICLGTQSQWGWHSFPNTENYKPEEVLKPYNFGHKIKNELYSCQFKEAGRKREACDHLRANPHRLHLGMIGFDFGKDVKPTDIHGIQQNLDLWRGIINSHFTLNGQHYDVHTVCHPTKDMVTASVTSEAKTPISIRLPYASGQHVDDGCDWLSTDKHTSSIVKEGNRYAVIKHVMDTTTYYITLHWNGNAELKETGKHKFVLTPKGKKITISAEFTQRPTDTTDDEQDLYATHAKASADSWQKFWKDGAAVDFSHCKDARARELERRVVLSQYLLAIQSAGSMPPQETGLTMNSWFGKFHLEMILWHESWLPLWGHTDKLVNTLNWYFKAEPMARQIARRQGFDGVRWMKMTDPDAAEAPSNVGSFLIWQQPHLIYLAELAYRGYKAEDANSTKGHEMLKKFAPLVDETAKFMYSFASYDKAKKRYILKGQIPAQESLKASVTYNSPYELSQWQTTMKMAQQWRERLGQKRNSNWDKFIDHLSPLAFNTDSLYLAAESAVDTYTDLKATSDHPALLGALGFYPDSELINKRVMSKTLDWIIANWNWPTSWGWDFPMTAMTATRMGEPDAAVNALLLDVQKNTYLNNGHNYQDGRLRLYLPGNGGLLSAVALMCAGWDGCDTKNPGFPKDGKWDVRWEGLTPLP